MDLLDPEGSSSQLTLVERGSPPLEWLSENPEISPPLKRYDFARDFTRDVITVLDGHQVAYHLSKLESLQGDKSMPVLLRDGRTNEALATILERPFLSDVITIQLERSNQEPVRIPRNSFLRECSLQGMGSVFVVNAPVSGQIGVSTWAPTGKLFWKVSSDNYSMTLYSTGHSPGYDTYSAIARASFSQTSPIFQLVAIEVAISLPEIILAYTFISALTIESRLRKKSQERERRSYFRGFDVLPNWRITPFIPG